MVVHLPSVGRHLCDGVTAHLDPTVTDTHHPGLVSTLSSDRSTQDLLYPLTLQRLNLQVAPTLTKKTPKNPPWFFFSIQILPFSSPCSRASSPRPLWQSSHLGGAFSRSWSGRHLQWRPWSCWLRQVSCLWSIYLPSYIIPCPHGPKTSPSLQGLG